MTTSTIDPHTIWLEEWVARHPGESAAERGARINRLSEQMLNTPANTVAGALAKITAAVEGGGIIEDIHEEVAEHPDGSAAMLASAMDDLERLAALEAARTDEAKA